MTMTHRFVTLNKGEEALMFYLGKYNTDPFWHIHDAQHKSGYTQFSKFENKNSCLNWDQDSYKPNNFYLQNIT